MNEQVSENAKAAALPTAEAGAGARDGDQTVACESAYETFQEGSRLLSISSAHAAVVVLERARDLEPDQGSIREALGRAYFRTGRFSQAKAEFARAVDIDPVNDYALFGLGLCLLREGDRDGARRPLKLAVAMRPDQPDYQAALTRARGR
jgi:tetratricopeptide (TPR) repeat protein